MCKFVIEQEEPYESRGSRTVPWERRGETPLRDPTMCNCKKTESAVNFVFNLKRMKILITSLLFLFFATTNAQYSFPHLKFNGNVSSVKTVAFQAIVKNGKIEKGNRKRKNSNVKAPLSYYEHYTLLNYEYTVVNNDKKKTIELDFKDSLGTIYLKDIYKYNVNDSLIDESEFWRISDTFSLMLHNKYNDNGKLIETMGINQGVGYLNKTNKEYSSNGNLIKTIIISDNDCFYTCPKYDEANNMIELLSFDCHTDSLTYKYTYKYDNKRNNLESNIYHADGILYNKHVSKYDNKNKLIEEYDVDYKGKISYRKIYLHNYNFNNKNERLFETKYFSTYRVDSLIKMYSTSKPDTSGNGFENYYTEDRFITKYVEIYYYDNKDRFIKSINFSRGNGDSLIEMNSISKYDTCGNRIEGFSYDSYGDINSADSLIYDVNKNLIEKYEYRRSDNPFYLNFTCAYDKNSNIIEENYYDTDGSLKQKFRFQYKYDKKNNWTEYVIFGNYRKDINAEKPDYIIERKIKYN